MSELLEKVVSPEKSRCKEQTMTNQTKKAINAKLRQNRVRSVVRGTSKRPRLSVFVSNLHISAQIIDDDKQTTLASASTVGKKISGSMTEKAVIIGKEIAKEAKKHKIKKIVLDRGAKLYHGRVKALAEAARQNGLEF
jgi:large subunit ribosomal protein L18